MNDNEKRKEFIKQLTSQVDSITVKKIEEENKKLQPTIGELADGYKSYIMDLGEGFLEIAEKYNECIQIAKYNEFVGDVKVKARIKDFSSSCTNTDVKLLDDVFGMELVTATEFEKEVLTLFNHLLFDINKDKKYNKKSGYIAYHCMGDFSPKEGYLPDIIKDIILNTKTREYRYTKNEPNNKDKKNLVDVFPNLQSYIRNSRNLAELIGVMSEMVEHMKEIDMPIMNMPIVEFHFLTKAVEQEAIRGTASHANYKNINTKLIEDYFMDGRLIRGINAPWKFVSDGEKLKLQDFYDTLLENWPFLRDEIVEKRKLGKERKEESIISKFDKLTATQFSFFRKYLNENYQYSDEQKAENWGLLKGIIIANRIDSTNKKVKSIEDGLVEYLGQ